MCHCKGNGGLSIRGLFGGMTSWIKYLLHSLIRKQLPRGLLQRFSFHLPPVLRLVMNMRRLRCFLSALHRTFTAWMCERGTRQSEETISSSKTQIVYKRPDFDEAVYGVLSEPYWGTVHLRYVKSRAWSSFVEACKIKDNKHLISQIYKSWLSMTNGNGRENSACRKLRMIRIILLKAGQRPPTQGPGGSSVGRTWYNLLWVQGWNLFKGVKCSIVFL